MCEGSFEVPTYTLAQDMVKNKIKLGILLQDSDYDIIMSDVEEFLAGTDSEDDRAKYLSNKYGVEFSKSKLTQARDRYYANVQ